ncbi:MAG: alginate lyase family protein [Vicinamibacterales bacterium]
MNPTLVAAPSPVFCVLGHAGRDLRVADEVVAGVFDVAGQRHRLGRRPDWTCDPCPDDKEWRIEWVKFYYGLDLAHAGAATGEARYGEAWARLVTSFVAQVPAAADDTEVMARRVQNWIYAWNRFQAAGRHPGLSAAQAPAVIDYLWAEVQHVRAHLTAERNHRTLELYALLVAALAFPPLDPGHALRDFAFDALHENLLADVRPDGVHREHSTHYHCIVLRSFLGALRNARLVGVTLPPSFLERTTRAAEFAMHCHRPDGAIPACADSDSESYRDVLRLAGELLDRPDFLWAASQGAEGRPPAARHASFPDGGYYTQRGGWGTHGRPADEPFLVFDCGALGDGGHGHYDALSVEVAAAGGPLLIDPGRFTYAEGSPNWRHWFKGTAAHNTVTVDGLDQTRTGGASRRARWRRPACSPARPRPTWTCWWARRRARATTRCTGAPWCSWPASIGSWRTTCRPTPRTSTRCAGILRPRPAATPRSPPTRPDGWWPTASPWPSRRPEHSASTTVCAPRYGVKHPAPVVVHTTAAASATIVTAIEPRGASRRSSALAVDATAPGNGRDAATRVEIRGVGPAGDATDVLMWSTAPQPLT